MKTIWCGLTVGIVGLASMLPSSLQACAVCFGNKDAAVTRGMALAILTLLGIVGTVLGSFVWFFIYLHKHGQQQQIKGA